MFTFSYIHFILFHACMNRKVIIYSGRFLSGSKIGLTDLLKCGLKTLGSATHTQRLISLLALSIGDGSICIQPREGPDVKGIGMQQR